MVGELVGCAWELARHVENRMLREPALERALDHAMPERQLRIEEPGSGGRSVTGISAWRCSAVEPVTMFFTRSDFEGVASTRVHRASKQFEAILDRLFGERVRADGAFGVDLWCALAGVEWRNGQGEMVSYSHRRAGDIVAWVREDGSYLEWYASGDPGEVVDWIGDALRDAGWTWSAPERDQVQIDTIAGTVRMISPA